MTEGQERWTRIEEALDEAETVIQIAFEESYGDTGPDLTGLFEDFCEMVFARDPSAQSDWEEWQET